MAERIRKNIKVLNGTTKKSMNNKLEEIYLRKSKINLSHNSRDTGNYSNTNTFSQEEDSTSPIIFEDSFSFDTRNKAMLDNYELPNLINETPCGYHETNCSLTIDELKIMYSIKSFRNINIDNINEDFKLFVTLSKQIQLKYSKKLCADTNSSANDKDDSSGSAASSTLVVDQQTITSISGSGKLLSKKLDVGNETNNSVDNDDINTLRRSTRKRKPVNRPICSILLSHEDNKELNKITRSNRRRKVSRKRLQFVTKATKDKEYKIRGKKSDRSETKSKGGVEKKVEIIEIARNSLRQSINTLYEEMETEDNLFDLFKKGVPKLPQQQLRALARNWMKPSKAVLF